MHEIVSKATLTLSVPVTSHIRAMSHCHTSMHVNYYSGLESQRLVLKKKTFLKYCAFESEWS